ncbi:MAG: TIGR03086 family metal-binding protein [Candidatus Dormibacteraceae bacterium]
MTARNQQAAMLEDVMRKTETLLAGVRPDQLGLPTPCSEWDVRQLQNHLVGWARHFAARESGQESSADPSTYEVSGDASGEFADSTGTLIAALDGKLSAPPEPPGEGAFPPTALTTMLIGEYVVHGWDLATATGQKVAFTDPEAEAALGLRSLLTPEYRGQMFGAEVEPPAGASSLQQLVAFAGRQPA